MSQNETLKQPMSPEIKAVETKYFYKLKLVGDEYDLGYVQFSNQFRLHRIYGERAKLIFKDDSKTHDYRTAPNQLNPKLDTEAKINIPKHNEIMDVALNDFEIDYNLNNAVSDNQNTVKYRVLDRQQTFITIQTDSDFELFKNILLKLDQPKEIKVPKSYAGRTFIRPSKIDNIQEVTDEKDPLYKLKPIKRIKIFFSSDIELRDFISDNPYFAD